MGSSRPSRPRCAVGGGLPHAKAESLAGVASLAHDRQTLASHGETVGQVRREHPGIAKSFAGRLPLTEYQLTPVGRRALEKYLAHMEALINAVRR